MDPLIWIDEQLNQLSQSDLLRELPVPLCAAGATVEIDGQQLVNFASNDYLGLAADERLVAAATDACRQQGIGRGASPLICGRAEMHAALEKRLAQFEQTEAALLFPTGFAVNAGIIPALVNEDDAIYSDAKNHASIVDGCRLASAETHIYPHGDTESLARLLQDSNQFRRRLIVTDSLFSMDGDLAPLVELGNLAERHDAMLMVDEAHATGVFGTHGRGVVEHLTEQHPRLHDQVHVRVGTLSKALGAAGGFVCGSTSLVGWLANRARTYVFSTAHPAATSAAAIAALEIVAEQPDRRKNLLEKSASLRSQLNKMGWNTGKSASQIIPLLVGSASETMRLAKTLREAGFWVGAIRPPSVPEGESLLRLGLTAGHTDTMIAEFVAALGRLDHQSKHASVVAS